MSEEMKPSPSPSAPGSKGMKAAIIALVLGLAAVTGYSMHEHHNAADLAAQNQQLATAQQQTQQQVQALNEKMTALTTPPPQPVVEQRAVHKRAASRKVARHRDDPRWKKMQDQLDAQNKRIDDTNAALGSTKTELSGNIARTHDELVVLERKGERNYYEFDIEKAKQFHTAGPVGIRLKKASTKDQFADLELYVDDAKLKQKHVNLLQPVMFYAGDSGIPVELVINKVTKNHIHGYVSAPKYRKDELTAMQNAVQNENNGQPQSGDSSAVVKPREKLTVPR